MSSSNPAQYYKAAQAAVATFQRTKDKGRLQAAWAFHYRKQWARAQAGLPPCPGLSEEQFWRFYDEAAIATAQETWPQRKASVLGHA
jgi:hypothetical protein